MFSTNRLVFGALMFFIVIVVGGTLTLRHVSRQTQTESKRTIGVTRQGKTYIKSPAWANTRAANARPFGAPLNINWKEPELKYIDWKEPRTWESYRNYWGFDPPKGDNFHPVEDNWGHRFRHYRNTAVIITYGKRQGFRPTFEEFERYKALKTELARAQAEGKRSEKQRLQQVLKSLIATTQGELPALLPRDGIYYGSSLTPEERRRRQAEATKALYKRMGIEHLYEFYEGP